MLRGHTIPLLAPDPDITIDLPAVFELTYKRGRYARVLDYEARVPPYVEPVAAERIGEHVKSSRT